MSKWKVTTHEGVEHVEIPDNVFDSGPVVDETSGALVFDKYVLHKGCQRVAIYNKDYWLKSEVVKDG